MQRLKTLFTNVTQKVSTTLRQINLNPINMFIKDSLDKILNDVIIGPEIKLEDIRKGSVALEQLLLNTDKINRQHLFSSPYILHRGFIDKLKIQLPSIRQLQTTSFSIQVQNIYLQLKPQSNFAQNFKTIIQEIKQYIRLNGTDDEEQNQPLSCQHDPRDYFKKLIKTMFRNLKVKIKNIVVVIYLDDPQVNQAAKMVDNKNKNEKNSILMLRVPLINVHRGSQSSLKDQLEENHKLQVVHFDIELPQFTVHLLQDQVSKQQRFPFKYPQSSHSGTILLFGQQNFIQSEIQKDQNIPRATITRTINYQKGEKDISISIMASTLQAMINPQQVKLMLLFVAQIKQFACQLQQIKKQLGLLTNNDGENNNSDGSLSIPLTMLNRRSSSSKRKGEDLFGSMCMSLWESNTITLSSVDHHRSSKRRSPDMIDNIIDQSNIKSEIEQLNKQIEQSLYHSISENNMPQETKQGQHIFTISIRRFFTISMKLQLIQLYIVKHLGSEHQQRSWETHINTSDDNTSIINNHVIKQSYFMFSLKNTKLSLKQRDEQMELQLQDVLVRHVKYGDGDDKNEKQDKFNKDEFKAQNISVAQQKKQQDELNLQSSEMEFFDVQGSMDYYLAQDRKAEILKKQDQYHYCAQDIMRITHKLTTHNHHPNLQNHFNQNKVHSFHPNLHYQDLSNSQQIQMYKPGVLITRKQTQKKINLMVQLMHIQLSVGSEFLLQLIEFCNVVQYMLQTDQGGQNANNSTVSNLNQSKPLQSNTKKIPTCLQLITATISVIFYESPLPKDFKSSVQKYYLQQQYHNTRHIPCFCQIDSSTGFYMFLKSFKLQSQSQVTQFAFSFLNIGVLNIYQSSTISHHSILSITKIQNPQHKKRKRFKFLYQYNSTNNDHNITLSLPQVQVNIYEKPVIDGLTMVKRQVQIFVPMIEKFFQQCSTNTQQKESTINTKGINMKKHHHHHHQQKEHQSVVRLKVSLTSTKINFLDLQLYLNNLSIQKTIDQMFLHLSTIVISSTFQRRTYQTQMREFARCQFVEIKSKNKDNSSNINIKSTCYPQIEDDSILFQMNNAQFAQKIVNSKSKVKQQLLLNNRSDQIVQLQQQSCLLIKVTEDRHSDDNSRNHAQAKQSIGVTLSSSIFVSAVNCLRVHHNKLKYESFVDRVMSLVDNLTRSQQKVSNQKQGLNGNKLQQQGVKKQQQHLPFTQSQQITISDSRLFIDIHPSFASQLPQQQMNKKNNSNHKHNHQLQHQDQQKPSEIILSNSRSVVQISWQYITVGNFPSNSQRYTNSTVNVSYYFTRIINTGQQHQNYNNSDKLFNKPLSYILHQTNSLLSTNLFQQILSLKSIKVSIQKIEHQIKFSISIQQIISNIKFDSLQWAMLHWQHFLKHDLNNNYGMTLQQCDDNIVQLKWQENLSSQQQQVNIQYQYNQNNSLQQQIQDLTQAQQLYNQSLNHKMHLKQQFVKKKFTQPQPNQAIAFFVQNLAIEKISLKLFYSPLAHLQTYLQGVKVVAKIGQKQLQTYKKTIQALVKLQQFQVILHQKYQQSSTLLGMVYNFWYKAQQEIFQIVRVHNPIKILIEINEQNIMAKVDKISLSIGFTSQLLKVIDQWDKIDQHIKQSGWKKVYQTQENKQNKQQKNQLSNQPKMLNNNTQKSKQTSSLLLLYCPQTNLNLTLVYEGLGILHQKRLDSPMFILHEQLSKPERIKSYVVRWVDSFIKDNIKGLIAASAMSSFGSLVAQLLRLVKVLVSMLLNCLG